MCGKKFKGHIKNWYVNIEYNQKDKYMLNILNVYPYKYMLNILRVHIISGVWAVSVAGSIHPQATCTIYDSTPGSRFSFSFYLFRDSYFKHIINTQ